MMPHVSARAIRRPTGMPALCCMPRFPLTLTMASPPVFDKEAELADLFHDVLRIAGTPTEGMYFFVPGDSH